MNDEVIKILERIATAIETNNELIRGECAAMEREQRHREKSRERMRKLRSGDSAQGEGALPTDSASGLWQGRPRPCDVAQQSEGEKETEDEKRDLPPTTPIERKEEEKEKDSLPRARESEDLKSVEEIAEKEVEAFKQEKTEVKQRTEVATKLFAAFWESYPRKIDKKKCLKKYINILAKDSHFKTIEEIVALHEKILAGLEKWKTSRDWVRGFVCDPYRFLFNERWTNVPQQASENKTNGQNKTPSSVLPFSAEELKKIEEEYS